MKYQVGVDTRRHLHGDRRVHVALRRNRDRSRRIGDPSVPEGIFAARDGQPAVVTELWLPPVTSTATADVPGFTMRKGMEPVPPAAKGRGVGRHRYGQRTRISDDDCAAAAGRRPKAATSTTTASRSSHARRRERRSSTGR